MHDTRSENPPIRVGTVPFLNAVPLTRGLEVRPGVALAKLFPAALGVALERGEVDAALVPVAAAFRVDGLRLFPGAAVASNGPVRSVRLFHARPLAQLRRVALDAGSVTSSALVRVILRRAHDARPEFSTAPPSLDAIRSGKADAALVIGDEALRVEAEAARDGLASLDLGAAWTEMTGLPFVYAAWALRSTAPPEIGPILRDARERGLAARREIAAEWAGPLGLPAASLASYLESNIRYDLGEREMRGLAAFREALLEEGLLDRDRGVELFPH